MVSEMESHPPTQGPGDGERRLSGSSLSSSSWVSADGFLRRRPSVRVSAGGWGRAAQCKKKKEKKSESDRKKPELEMCKGWEGASRADARRAGRDAQKAGLGKAWKLLVGFCLHADLGPGGSLPGLPRAKPLAES